MISIATRFHPFSHQPGISFLLPGTFCKVKIYPTRLCFISLSTEVILDLDLIGPIDQFTAELDLESNYLKVWGETQLGFVRMRIFSKEDGVWLYLEKAPGGIIDYLCAGVRNHLKIAESLHVIKENIAQQTQILERLSLGVSKAQEWEKMKQRQEMKELFPLWMRIGQLLPKEEKNLIEKTAMFKLLNACKEMVERREKTKILEMFRQFFLAAFEGVLIPRVVDTEFLGIVKNETLNISSKEVFFLLTESAVLLRSLFFQEKEGVISLLPCLPPEFHCGRMLHIKTGSDVSIDFEWTKKSLRRVRLSTGICQILVLLLPKGYSRCRLKCGKKIEEISIENGSFSIDLSPRQEFWLDRFQ